MKKTRRSFTNKQKSDFVLKIIKKEKTASELSKEHGILVGVLLRWKDEFLMNAENVFGNQSPDKSLQEKISKYEQVIAKLTTQNDFLDKILSVTR